MRKFPTNAQWDIDAAGIEDTEFVDLLTNSSVTTASDGHRRVLKLAPGQAMCLTADKTDVDLIENYSRTPFALPPRIVTQRLRAKALEIVGYYRGTCDMSDLHPDSLVDILREDPPALCRQLHPHGDEPRVIQVAMAQRQQTRSDGAAGTLPDGVGRAPFRSVSDRRPADTRRRKQLALLLTALSSFFSLLRVRTPGFARCNSNCRCMPTTEIQHTTAPLMFLPDPHSARHQCSFRRSELKTSRLVFLAANASGAALRIPVAWGELTSRYDALLAANLHPDHPQDRWIMLTRCRIWLAYQGYSQELNRDCFQHFNIDPSGSGRWRFLVPCGQGQHVAITVSASLAISGNRIDLTFTRHRADKKPENLPDSRSRGNHCAPGY